MAVSVSGHMEDGQSGKVLSNGLFLVHVTGAVGLSGCGIITMYV